MHDSLTAPNLILLFHCTEYFELSGWQVLLQIDIYTLCYSCIHNTMLSERQISTLAVNTKILLFVDITSSL